MHVGSTPFAKFASQSELYTFSYSPACAFIFYDMAQTQAVPNWKDLEARLADLIGSRLGFPRLLSRLCSNKILTSDEFDCLIRPRNDDDAARDLLRIIRHAPRPSFDEFWIILGTEIDGGNDLRSLERRDTPLSSDSFDVRVHFVDPSMADHLRPGTEGVPVQVAHEQDETSSVNAFRADSDRRQHTPTSSSPSQMQPDGQRRGESLQAPRQIIIIEVVRSLEDKFKKHESTLREIVLHCLKNAYSKPIELEPIFPPEISRKRTFRIGAEVKIRILFPNTNVSCFQFQPNDAMIKAHLCRIMDLKESDLEIYVTEGSITLTLFAPGQGLISMLVGLGQNAELLKFLLDVDKSAKISFGDLPYVSVSVFSRRSSQRATVEKTEIVVKEPHEIRGIGDALPSRDYYSFMKGVGNSAKSPMQLFDDESRRSKIRARLSFEKFNEELSKAETEVEIDHIGRNFERQTEVEMESVIQRLKKQYHLMAEEKQGEEVKASFENSLRHGVFEYNIKREYDFQKERFQMQQEHRKQELYFEVTSNFLCEITEELLKRKESGRGISAEEAEDLFHKRWDAFEPKAIVQLRLKRSDTRAEVQELFVEVAASAKYEVASMPQSEQSGFFSGKSWTKYVTLQTYRSRSENDYDSSSLPEIIKEIVEKTLRPIRDEAKSVVNNLIDSLSGSNPRPFDRKLVKATVDEAVSVTERAEGTFTRLGGFLFLTTQFMTDFVFDLASKSIDSLLAQQTKDEERAKEKLREIKEEQRRHFLAFIKL